MKSVLAVATSALCLFTSTASAASSSHVLSVTKSQLKDVKSRVDQLTENINNWNHTLDGGLFSIQMPAVAIASYLLNATDDLKKIPTTFSIDDAFRVAGSVQDLAYSVNNSVAALNRQIKDFTAAFFDPVAVDALNQLLNSTKIYSNELITNVQVKLRPVAYALQDQALGSIQQGIDCFNNPNNTVACNDAMIDPERTHKAALRWGAIRPDGSPIA